MVFQDLSFVMYGAAFGVLFYVLFFQRQKRQMAMLARVMGDRLLGKLTENLSLQKRYFKWFLQILVLFFMLVALARPRVPGATQKIESVGIELIIAFDVSQSMMAEDVRPNRLEFAKKEIERLIELLPGSKIALLPFAGSAYLSSPLTTDKSAFKMFLTSLSPVSVSAQGTHFAAALQSAQEAMERGGESTEGASVATRAILFVSDGEDHEPEAVQAAQQLAEKGVRIFSMAVGTEQGAPIPLRDGRGFLQGYLQEKDGTKVLTRSTGESLRQLAEAGKGSFHFATFGGTAAQRIATELNQLEQTSFEDQLIQSYDEKFQIPLALAILLALIELCFAERKTLGKFWKGRFEVNA